MMRIARDKKMHFVVCAAASLVVMVLFRAISSVVADAALASVLCSLSLGVGKEYGDKVSPGNRWDWWDFAADAAGAVAGMLTGSLLWLL